MILKDAEEIVLTDEQRGSLALNRVKLNFEEKNYLLLNLESCFNKKEYIVDVLEEITDSLNEHNKKFNEAIEEYSLSVKDYMPSLEFIKSDVCIDSTCMWIHSLKNKFIKVEVKIEKLNSKIEVVRSLELSDSEMPNVIKILDTLEEETFFLLRQLEFLLDDFYNLITDWENNLLLLNRNLNIEKSLKGDMNRYNLAKQLF